MPIQRHPIAHAVQDSTLDRIPIDQALIARLRNMYHEVRNSDLQLASIFYRKLFTAQPVLRRMFPNDLNQQAEKLIALLDTVVDNFECPAENARLLSELGIRHQQYGATKEHYGVVVDLLIESMAELLNVKTTDPRLEEWQTVLQLISGQMIAATKDRD